MLIPQSIEIVANFVVKIVFGVFAFLILGGAAIAINLFNAFASSHALVPGPVLTGLTGLEYVIFALDTICFGYFLVVESIGYLRDVTALLKDQEH